MPDSDAIVINTGPILALVAACGDLGILASVYRQVLVPFEVCSEVGAGGRVGFGLTEFAAADYLVKQQEPTPVTPYLSHALGPGEAAVIQLALDRGIPTVCIDESVGRRLARLSGLKVTGSLGVLLKAKRQGLPVRIQTCIERMRSHGVWVSDRVATDVLRHAGESGRE
jgi:predicted nucleic acid-binding protein